MSRAGWRRRIVSQFAGQTRGDDWRLVLPGHIQHEGRRLTHRTTAKRFSPTLVMPHSEQYYRSRQQVSAVGSQTSGSKDAVASASGAAMTDRDAVQRRSARQMASERAPTKRRLTAQVASKLNQLRDTNFSPK